MELLAILFVFIVVMAVVLFSFSLNSRDKDSHVSPQLAHCPAGFVPTFAYMEKYGGAGIALDQQSKTFRLVKPDSPNHIVVPHHNLRAAIVLQDGIPIATAVRNDPDAQQALTIALESIVGGAPPTEGQSPQPTGAIERIDLNIIHKAPDDPIHSVNFLNMEAKVGGFIYNDAVQHVKMRQDLLAALIHLADQAPTPVAPPPKLLASSNI